MGRISPSTPTTTRATRTYKNYRLNAAGAPIPTGPVSDYANLQPFIRPQRHKLSHVYARDGWQFAQSRDFAASVRNLFDADVRELTAAPGLALPYDLPMSRHNL